MCLRDRVYIATPWLKHVPMAVYAMEHGKHVAVEVPAAQSLEECWQLVNTAEKYQRHCMMLENCVYDFFELTTLNMARHGLFGEILHVEGSYIHNLDEFWDYYQGCLLYTSVSIWRSRPRRPTARPYLKWSSRRDCPTDCFMIEILRYRE